MVAIIAWDLVILFLLGLLSVPMPLSVPPLPEDQKLLQAVPSDTIAYVSWFGRAKANPNSQNRTERLSAEPQVRALVLAVGHALRKAWELEARDDGPLAVECFNALALAVERPGCLFLSGVDLPPKPFSLRIGLVVHLGARAALLGPTLQKLEDWYVREATRGNGEVRPFEALPGLRFRGLPMPDGAPPLSWGIVDGYLVLTLGEGMAKRVAGGLRGEGDGGLARAPLFEEVQGKVRVARPCFRTFLDLGKVLELAKTGGGRDVERMLQLFGLTDLQAILSETGLEGDGFVARSMLATKARSGMLALLDGPPLAREELAIIPGDATLAGAMRVDAKKMYARMVETLGAIDPRVPQEFARGVVEPLQKATGLDLEKDLLAHLGDTFALWNSPAQGGLLITGLTLAVELDDPVAFKASFAKAMGALREMVPPKQVDGRGRVRRGGYIETMQVAGTQVYFLNTVGDAVPVAPAWCVSDGHLLVSMFPQMLRATLERGAQVEGSIAAHPRVQGAPPAAALMLFDAPRLFRSVYPVLHVLGQLGASQVQRTGLDLDISVLPTAGSIQPHLSVETSVLEARPDGVLLTRKGTIPTVDPFLGFAVPAFGAMPMWLMQGRAVRAMRAAERARADAVRREAEVERQREELKKGKKQER